MRGQVASGCVKTRLPPLPRGRVQQVLAASSSLPTHSYSPRSNLSGLCLTPGNILQEAVWHLLSSHPAS